MEEPLDIQSFELNQLPSATHFASQIESKNVPAVFKGCVKNWKAFSRWNTTNAGLDYLQERLGASIVEAMLSRTAPVFYGDIRSHERVPLPFSTFVGLCKRHKQNMGDGCDDEVKTRNMSARRIHHRFILFALGRWCSSTTLFSSVVLWSPSASPMLYPMPIYGEASNHSSIALENPDFSSYPRAEHSREYSQKVILHAGSTKQIVMM